MAAKHLPHAAQRQSFSDQPWLLATEKETLRDDRRRRLSGILAVHTASQRGDKVAGRFATLSKTKQKKASPHDSLPRYVQPINRD